MKPIYRFGLAAMFVLLSILASGTFEASAPPCRFDGLEGCFDVTCSGSGGECVFDEVVSRCACR